MKLIPSSSLNEMCLNLAYDIEEASKQAIAEHGRFSLVLSGGNTPLALFNVLVQHFHGRIEWPLVDIFWTDERYVIHTHAESNYGNAFKYLIKHLSFGNVFPINITGKPHDDAKDYENILINYFKNNVSIGSRFDYIILGFGLDGHIASLFCEDAVFNNEESVVVTIAPDEKLRISLSYARILNAKNIVLILSGVEKFVLLNQVLNGCAEESPLSRLPVCTRVFFDAVTAEISNKLT